MNSIIKKDNLKIIINGNNKKCIKRVEKNIFDKYKYLKSKNFLNIMDYQYVNGYEIRDYLEDISLNKEEKISELLYLVTMLHIKTTHYKSLTISDIKRFYESETDEIFEIKNYYNKICEEYDLFMIMPPSVNLLIDNISLIFNSLDKSKMFLDKWYDVMKLKKRKRVVFNHNNLKDSNIIVNNNSYLINWNKSKIDSPIYDLLSLFKNNIKEIDLIDMFNIYESKYKLTIEEINLLFCKLLKIDKLLFNKKDIINTREVYYVLYYLNKINNFLDYYLKCEK